MHGREQLRAWIARAKFATNRAAAEFLGVNEQLLCQVMQDGPKPRTFGLANAAQIQERTGIPAVSWVETRRGTQKAASRSRDGQRVVKQSDKANAR